MLLFPWQCPIAESGAAGRRCPALPPGLSLSWLRSTECCWCSSLKAEWAYNDYVRTRRRLSREVSSSTQHFPFGLEAVLILLLEAGGNLQPTEAWLISLLKCWAPSSLKYFCPIVNSDKWWFVAFMWGVYFAQVLSPLLGSYILWQVSLEYEGNVQLLFLLLLWVALCR